MRWGELLLTSEMGVGRLATSDGRVTSPHIKIKKPGTSENIVKRSTRYDSMRTINTRAQLNRATALSLVINAIIVWNTRYLGKAATELDQEGRAVPDDAWSHLSPMLWEMQARKVHSIRSKERWLTI